MTDTTVAVRRDKAYPTCGARTRQGDHSPCARPAGWGTDHPGVGACKLHGGATFSARVAARKTMAANELAALGQEVDVDPESALLALVRKTQGDVRFWQDLVALLEPVNGGDEWSVAGPNHLGDAAPHVFVLAYERAVERAADVASRAIKAGLQLRQAELTEAQGRLVAELASQLVADIRNAPDETAALRVLGSRLRELTEGSAA